MPPSRLLALVVQDAAADLACDTDPGHPPVQQFAALPLENPCRVRIGLGQGDIEDPGRADDPVDRAIGADIGRQRPCLRQSPRPLLVEGRLHPFDGDRDVRARRDGGKSGEIAFDDERPDVGGNVGVVGDDTVARTVGGDREPHV